MMEWRVLQVTAKVDGRHKVTPTFLAFASCMTKRFIRTVGNKKIKHFGRDLVISNQEDSFHSSENPYQ